MVLKRVDIVNFKNIASAQLEFSEGVNCLLGMNGTGKSNLLDSIHFLCMARPMSFLPDSSLISHQEELALVKGVFETETGGEDSISAGITRGKGKRLKRNGKEYRLLSEHIGRFPVVTVTPGDSRLISGSGEERRKMMDTVISQADPAYLSALIRYNKSLESRNKMLRAGVNDSLLYESVEAGLTESAEIIKEARAQWVKSLTPMVEEAYAELSGNRESATMDYRSRLNEKSMKELLEERRRKDFALGFTSAGIHRDDIETRLDGYSLRNLGSQGQIKTFTVAFKLAIFNYLKSRKQSTPLLLLDDIFDKLDADRVENIMRMVSSSDTFGQIFITDTNRKHLDDILAGIEGPRTLVSVDNGVFTPMETT